MKELEKTIETGSFIFVQEFRNDKYAIYAQYLKESHDRKKKNILVAYELIKIRKNKEFERFGKKHGDAESYPNEKSWGDEGWTFKTFSEAKKRLIEYETDLPNLPYSDAVAAFSLEKGSPI